MLYLTKSQIFQSTSFKTSLKFHLPACLLQYSTQIFHMICTIVLDLQICCSAEDSSIMPSTFLLSFVDLFSSSELSRKLKEGVNKVLIRCLQHLVITSHYKLGGYICYALCAVMLSSSVISVIKSSIII